MESPGPGSSWSARKAATTRACSTRHAPAPATASRWVTTVAACPAPLVCDQVEYHPYLDQSSLREACARHELAIIAYSPIAKGRVGTLYVKGRGATITDIQGREYIDGLAGLWNTNVGHGREELLHGCLQFSADPARDAAHRAVTLCA